MNKPPGALLWKDETPLLLECGHRLPEIEVAFETWGRLNRDRTNAILVCPAFSAHSHARSSEADPTPGWWEGMVGGGLAFDTRRFHVICASLLGGCFGTTGPRSVDPRTGRKYGADFPTVTIRDIVDVHLRLLDHLGIRKLWAAAGGSMGGMEALEIAVREPDRVARVITISGTDRTRAFTATIRNIGRRAIITDPGFRDGRYGDRQPREGLRLARELGTIFYRSRPELNQRFSLQPIIPMQDLSADGINFDFQSYLDYQGRKAPILFDANSYLRLSLAMDLHDVARGFSDLADALSRVQASFLVGGVLDDLLIPIDEQRLVHDTLLSLGRESTWMSLSSPYGHDAFLKEFDDMSPGIQDFLA